MHLTAFAPQQQVHVPDRLREGERAHADAPEGSRVPGALLEVHVAVLAFLPREVVHLAVLAPQQQVQVPVPDVDNASVGVDLF